MNPTNARHITLQRVQKLYRSKLAHLDHLTAAQSSIAEQLDFALHNQSANFKLLHPLLIGKYSRMTKHHKDEPFDTVGLDIETIHTTGEPRLMGFSFDSGYYKIDSPTLDDFFQIVRDMIDNRPGTSLSVWGNLDIQCILRLFNPDEIERKFVSGGISANFKQGKFVGSPPIMRYMGDQETPFFVDHYIAGRSLRLGIQFGERVYTLWIFNLSQFYAGTISQTAQGLGMDWIEYPKDTHLVDWERYESEGENSDYYANVVASNRQDAVVARDLAYRVQENFAAVFEAYPKILVSVGSLADAAVSKLLTEAEYNANSFRWLQYNVWGNYDDVAKTESLSAECFSAGYVDQFGIGYYDHVYMADIAAAYPDKIRHLPDLRDSRIFVGSGNLRGDIARLKAKGNTIFTAMIRGVAHIPETLKYHPITIKTPDRQNIRPTGTFKDAYLLEERTHCIKYGATFTGEEYSIIYMVKTRLAPIAKISRKLRIMRDAYLADLKRETDENKRTVLDGMQYLTKIVDNSLYGKTVMSTPIVADIEGTPKITGYRAGDRYNQIYGSVITGRTRIQISEACMQIEKNGGTPILAMTDSIFWTGTGDEMPAKIWRDVKTPGYFETPERLEDFYIIKTGQYEYRKGDKFYHKMRGLNIPFENRKSDRSYYRAIIKAHATTVSPYSHPEDFAIPVETRKLVTIGAHDLKKLGLVEEKIAMMRPFILSGKQVERFIMSWGKLLDGNLKLATPKALAENLGDTPLEFLRNLHEAGEDYLNTYQRKQMYLYKAAVETQKLLPAGKKLSDCTWEYLVEYYGFPVEELVSYGGTENEEKVMPVNENTLLWKD